MRRGGVLDPVHFFAPDMLGKPKIEEICAQQLIWSPWGQQAPGDIHTTLAHASSLCGGNPEEYQECDCPQSSQPKSFLQQKMLWKKS